MSHMLTLQPIGFVSSPYQDTAEVPKGLGAKHEAEGVLMILPEFEAGLADIEGFSHLFVIWPFDRSQGFELLTTPSSDNRPHGVFATRSPKRPNPSASQSLSSFGAMAVCCTCEASICSKDRRFSTSSLT
jgi:tRNA (adenine37-N6)-methyltransferase